MFCSFGWFILIFYFFSCPVKRVSNPETHFTSNSHFGVGFFFGLDTPSWILFLVMNIYRWRGWWRWGGWWRRWWGWRRFVLTFLWFHGFSDSSRLGTFVLMVTSWTFSLRGALVVFPVKTTIFSARRSKIFILRGSSYEFSMWWHWMTSGQFLTNLSSKKHFDGGLCKFTYCLHTTTHKKLAGTKRILS